MTEARKGKKDGNHRMCVLLISSGFLDCIMLVRQICLVPLSEAVVSSRNVNGKQNKQWPCSVK